MKKKTGLIIIVSAIFLMMLAVLFFGRGKRYNDSIIGETSATGLTQFRTEDPGMVSEVRFGSERLIPDEESGTYFYSLMEDDPMAYNPLIRAFSNGEKLGVSVIGGAVGDKGVRLLFYDKERYCEKNLVFTTLPLMNISCGSEIDLEERPVSMELIDNRKGADKRLVVSDGTIMVRGGTTSGYPKKPYKLSLTATSLGNHKRNNAMSLLGMRKDDDWVLYAAYNDQEKIRNVFSQNLWAESCGGDNSYGIDASPCYNYIELFIDGQYMGLYALGYTPDEKSLGLDNSKTEGYFKKKDSGLHKFEVKNKAAELAPAENEKLTRLIYDYFYELGDNCHDGTSLKKAVDLENAIDFYLFVCLIQGTDNLHKNYYVVLKETDDGYKSVYIPWDMDMAWGNMWYDDDLNNLTWAYHYDPEENFLFTDGYMYWLLFDGEPEVSLRLVEKYRQLRAGAWSDARIDEMLSGYEKDIFLSGAYDRDKERWPDGNYLKSGMDYSLEVFKSYVMDRLHCMDEYIARLEEGGATDSFVRDSLRFADFKDSTFVIRFDNRQALLDEDYRQLFDHMGVDLSMLSADSGFVVANPSRGVQDTVTWDEDLTSGAKTGAGVLRAGRLDIDYDYEDEYSVLLGDLDCMDVLHGDLPLGISVISPKGYSQLMNLDKSYVPDFSIDEIQDPYLALESLRFTDGNALVVLGDGVSGPYLSFLDKYELDSAEYDSLEEILEVAKGNDGTDGRFVVLLNGKSRRACVVPDAFTSGTVSETPLGTYSYFETDGGFGIYLNGMEVLTGETDDLDGEDVRIMQFSDDYSEYKYIRVYNH